MIKPPMLMRLDCDVGEFKECGPRGVPYSYAKISEEDLFRAMEVDKTIYTIGTYLSSLRGRGRVFGIDALRAGYTIRDFVITAIHETLHCVSDNSLPVEQDDLNYFVPQSYNPLGPRGRKATRNLLEIMHLVLNRNLNRRRLLKKDPISGAPIYPGWES